MMVFAIPAVEAYFVWVNLNLKVKDLPGRVFCVFFFSLGTWLWGIYMVFG
jgi:hypothetical protein